MWGFYKIWKSLYFEYIESIWLLQNFLFRLISKFFKINILFFNLILPKIINLYSNLFTNIYFQQDLIIPIDEKKSNKFNKNLNSFKDV